MHVEKSRTCPPLRSVLFWRWQKDEFKTFRRRRGLVRVNKRAEGTQHRERTSIYLPGAAATLQIASIDLVSIVNLI